MKSISPMFPRLMLFISTTPATTSIYTLSYTTLFRSVLKRARKIAQLPAPEPRSKLPRLSADEWCDLGIELRSEEHTSELQSHSDLVCRLLLEKKKNNRRVHNTLI